MKKKIKKSLSLIMICMIFVMVFSACSKNKKENINQVKKDTKTEDTQTGAKKKLNGTITMAGSTSMEKLANAAAEAFMAKYPGVMISPEFIGSGAGIEGLLKGTVEIGNSSRNLTEDEKKSGAVENIVAIDGIAVVVDKANQVKNLTKDQLVGIYEGTTTNWKDLGGSDQPIVVIGREAGSGTRDAFEELLGLTGKAKYANEINSTGGVMAKAASTPGAIGYVSLDVLDNTVNSLMIENVAPTEKNIKESKYLLSRPFVMATKGEISRQSELVQTFFKYMKSEEGKTLVKSVGLITVD